MKISMLCLLVCAVALTSCINPIQARVSAYPGMYEKLKPAEKEAVNSGAVKDGMSKNAVYFAWGAPWRMGLVKRDGKIFERWGYGGMYAPSYYGVPPGDFPGDARFVEFEKGRVTRFWWPLPH